MWQEPRGCSEGDGGGEQEQGGDGGGHVDWWVVLVVLVEECVDGRTDQLQLEMNRIVVWRLERLESAEVLTRLGQVNTLFTSYLSALGHPYLQQQYLPPHPPQLGCHSQPVYNVTMFICTYHYHSH